MEQGGYSCLVRRWRDLHRSFLFQDVYRGTIDRRSGNDASCHSRGSTLIVQPLRLFSIVLVLGTELARHLIMAALCNHDIPPDTRARDELMFLCFRNDDARATLFAGFPKCLT